MPTKTDAPLPKIKIASPCPARWDDMAGDDTCRFCTHCEKHVYNFSKLTQAQILELIRSREGKICGRIYQRTDGTILTSDCPVGLEKVAHRIKLLVCSAVAGVTLCVSTLFACRTPPNEERAQTKFEQQWDDLTWKVKGFLGIQRPMPLVGEICIQRTQRAPIIRLTPPTSQSLPHAHPSTGNHGLENGKSTSCVPNRADAKWSRGCRGRDNGPAPG